MDFKSLGNKAFTSGDYETAIKYFTQGIEQEPTHVLYSNRSASFASLGQYANALEDAEKAISMNPSWSKGYSRKGAALHGLSRLDEAAQAYKAGLQMDPENAQLKKGLEDVEAAMGSTGLESIFGGDLLGKVAANPKLAPLLAQPDLVAKLQEIQKNPKNINMYMNDPRMMNIMIGLMGLDGKVATSAEEAQQAMQEERQEPAPKQSPPKPAAKQPEPEPELTPEEKEKKDIRAKSDEAKAKGNQAYKKRSFDEALQHYDQAWDLDNTNVAVLTNKSAVLFEMEKYQECISTAEQAVEIGRSLRADFTLIARALGRIGTAYSKLQDYDNAIKYYGKSLAEHRTADILEKLRETEVIKKKKDEEAYQDPKLSDEAREKGNEYFKAHNYAEAVKYYTNAIKRNPKDARNYSNRAAAYIKLMAMPEADKDCDEAISLDPNFVKAYIRKSNVLFAKRDYMKCVEMCNQALSIDTEGKHAAEIQGQIQKAYFALNQVQGGNKEETLKNAMNNPEVAQIMNDPVMQTILRQMQEDPGAVQDHMKNPSIAAKIRTLINAGIIQTR